MYHSVKNTYTRLIEATVLVTFLFVMLFVTSCAELDSHSKLNRFKDSENIFKASLRWGEWMNLLQLQKADPDNKQLRFDIASEQYLEQLSHIKVTHVESIGAQMSTDGTRSKTIYLIEYHLDDSSSIKKIRHTVDWWHDEETNRWYTSSVLPEEFKEHIKPKLDTYKLSPKTH